MRNAFGSWKTVLALCAAGVGLRLVFLALTTNLDLLRDEGHYIYLALSWNRFGFYPDGLRYLWPPGFPLFLAWCLSLFGAQGVVAAKLVQVLASASIGICTMALAERLFGARGALIAGVLWCVHLPLIGYTHTLWNETLFLAFFLPSLVLLASVLEGERRALDARIAGAAALLALALYVKDAPLYLLPVFVVMLVLARGGARPVEGVRRALLFVGVVAVLVLPWTLRNLEVYGRIVPMGSTLAENVFRGLNGTYRNFDLGPFQRKYFSEESPVGRSRPWFIETDGRPDWERAEGIANTPDRLAETTRRGLAYAALRPGWLIRSRIKKLADFVAPYSFFVRHMGLGEYEDTPLGGTAARRALLAWAVLVPVVILGCAIPGLVFAVRRRRAADQLALFVIAYLGATSLLVSMSRFRIAMMPFLIVMAAGFLAGRAGSSETGRLHWGVVSVGWALLALLWWVNVPETSAILGIVWRGGV